MAYEGPHPLPVPSGGTGDASLTAYAVLCGGTTSTAAVQSIAGVGSSGQVLTSNGAGMLPTFQTSSSTYYSLTPFIVGPTGDTHAQYTGGEGLETAMSDAGAQYIATGFKQNVYIKPGTYQRSVTSNPFDIPNGVNIIGFPGSTGSSNGTNAFTQQLPVILKSTLFNEINGSSIIENINIYADAATSSPVAVAYRGGTLVFNNCWLTGNNLSTCVSLIPDGPYGCDIHLTNCVVDAKIIHSGTSTVNYTLQGTTFVGQGSSVAGVDAAGPMIFNILASYIYNFEFKSTDPDSTGSLITVNANSSVFDTCISLIASTGAITYNINNSKISNGISGLKNSTAAAVNAFNCTQSTGFINTPPSSNTATTAFGTSLTAGTAVQNTTGYELQVNISVEVTAATTATIAMGVGPTSTPTKDTVIPSFTVAATTFFTFTAIVPPTYYLLVDTTGTITVASITTQACPL